MSDEAISTRRRSLALELIEAQTFDHDVEVSDRFQKFSEEITLPMFEPAEQT